MKLIDLLLTYWSQVTLVLLALAYLVKRVLDNKSRKIEINHTIFQTNRLSSANKFFSNYSNVELLWQQIEIYDIFHREIDVKEIDRIVFPSINALKSALLELKIYFKPNEFVFFEELATNIVSVNQEISRLYFIDKSQKDVNSKIYELEYYKGKMKKQNKEILEKLYEMLWKNYS